MVRRPDLLAELKSENEAWEALLADIGEDRMETPGVAGQWSIKDIVAHITAWRRRTVGRVEALARGDPTPPPPWPEGLKDDDDINAWFHAQDRDQSVKHVLAESRRVFEQLAAGVAKLPDAVLNDAAPLGWTPGTPLSGAGFFGHFHDEHEPDMRAWLARQTAGAV